VTRCTEGHFFDPTKHSSCPWCSRPIDLGAGTNTDGISGRTMAVGTPAAPQAGMAAGATRRLVGQEMAVDPVVGWLVCIDGPDRGQDYRLHSQKNFIGRSPSMDVAIQRDDSVSRDKHATITFEPKKRTFWLVPGESSGLVYLNNEVVYSAAQLNPQDVIEVGRTKLILVAFVNDSFEW
jgi:hypothetical protein